ncbi:MAG: iron-containing alcohol dehydrogenase [Planctomycetota bacterium]
MTDAISGVQELLGRLPTRVVYGPGTLSELGQVVASYGAGRIFLVSDRGLVNAGHVERAVGSLEQAGLHVVPFVDVVENPDSNTVHRALPAAEFARIDFIVGLGGGSVMDCAKGINLILTNGGTVRDYWGINKAVKPMLPSVLIPTTAGTGSEAQSFALISDPSTHRKMACGDKRPPGGGGLRPLVAILDPDLTFTAPKSVTAAVGMDAIAHAVETAATTKKTPGSLVFTTAAWNLLDQAFPRVLRSPDDPSARMQMLLGAHLAGAAIEQSMLGAAHACANPLTACHGIVHGQAVGLMLPHVIRFNIAAGENPYAALGLDGQTLATRIEELLISAALPTRLKDLKIPAISLTDLSDRAAMEWTAGFNSRPVGPGEILALYRLAYG